MLLKEIGSNSFQVKLCQGLTAVIATIAPDNDDEINRKVSNVNGICCKTIRTSSFGSVAKRPGPRGQGELSKIVVICHDTIPAFIISSDVTVNLKRK